MKVNEPLWYNDLIMCPSQCYCNFITEDGDEFCIYMRWRWDDPWSVAVVPFYNGDFCYDADWEYVDLGYFSHDDYARLQKRCVRYVEEKYKVKEWLRYESD